MSMGSYQHPRIVENIMEGRNKRELRKYLIKEEIKEIETKRHKEKMDIYLQKNAYRLGDRVKFNSKFDYVIKERKLFEEIHDAYEWNFNIADWFVNGIVDDFYNQVLKSIGVVTHIEQNKYKPEQLIYTVRFGNVLTQKFIDEHLVSIKKNPNGWMDTFWLLDKDRKKKKEGHPIVIPNPVKRYDCCISCTSNSTALHYYEDKDYEPPMRKTECTVCGADGTDWYYYQENYDETMKLQYYNNKAFQPLNDYALYDRFNNGIKKDDK